MIKLLGFLFTLTLVYGEDQRFILPDHHARSSHFLHQAIKRSSSVWIVTPTFSHTELSKTIISSARKQSRIHLIVKNTQGEPRRLVQYRHIDLSISRIPIPQSMILIDNSLACTVDEPIDEEIFSSKHTVLLCSDDSEIVRSVHKRITSLLNHSTGYLE